jgi:hypothetical protein
MESRVLQVASSFTSAPLKKTLQPLLVKAGIADEVAFAQYAQMAEYMLGDASSAPHIVGTLVWLRIEDWLRDDAKAGAALEPGTARHKLRRCVEDFVGQLSALASRGKAVWFLACPSVGWVAEKYRLEGLCRTNTNLLAARVRNQRQVTMLNWPAAVRAEEIGDRNADRLGQIPFSAEGFRQIADFVGEQLERTFVGGMPGWVATVGSEALAGYLAGLGVKVRMFPAGKEERGHVDHLLRTAAAFSLTGDKPGISDAEVDAVLESGERTLIAVSDRLGEYGVSGLAAFRVDGETLRVEALALSCPVLGKQTEWAVLAGLGHIAAERRCSRIQFEFRASGRNQLMLSFLQSISEESTDGRYVLAVSEAEAKIRAEAVAPGTWTVELPKCLPHR